VSGCTEHRRADGPLFCAHPAYRGFKQWYDWAVFKWDIGEPSKPSCILIPGQIIMFIEITELMASMTLECNLRMPAQGLCALIETLEEPLRSRGKGTGIVVPSSKRLTPEQRKKRPHGERRLPSIYLVPVDAIHSPIAAIPNVGGQAGDFLFVRPTNEWAEGFRDYISICHGDK